MGDMSEYYDDRDFDAKEDLQRMFGLGENYKTRYEYSSRNPKHLIYQNKLMDDGIGHDERVSMCAEQFNKNSIMKVGDKMNCPSCNIEFTKTHYQQKFCKSKVKGKSSCKDFFYNFASSTARSERTKNCLEQDEELMEKEYAELRFEESIDWHSEDQELSEVNTEYDRGWRDAILMISKLYKGLNK